MSAENAWKAAMEEVAGWHDAREVEADEAAERAMLADSIRRMNQIAEMHNMCALTLRSLPMPPAFRAAVEAESEELRGMLGEAKRLLQSYSKDSIKLTDHQARKADTAAFLSRPEAKGESQ